MKEPFTSVGVFFKTLGSCMSSAWKQADSEYHIPKSRFRYERNSVPGNGGFQSGLDERVNVQHFRRFQHCFIWAWEAADNYYHIPKSRHGRATEKQV